jgi:hypothetical protein
MPESQAISGSKKRHAGITGVPRCDSKQNSMNAISDAHDRCGSKTKIVCTTLGSFSSDF